LVRAAAEAGLSHSHYFQSGIMGSGLLTLSRYPIVASSFLRFRLNGRPQDLIRSDYYAGKGVGRLRLRTPKGPVDVYNAHFIAPYLEFGPDRFAAHRVMQALEAGRYMAEQSEGIPAILTCDLNCYTDDTTFLTIMAAGELAETCSAAHGCDDPPDAVERNGYANIHPPARLDYIFSRSGAATRLVPVRTQFLLGGAPSPNPDRVAGYSDHYGVHTEFELSSIEARRAAHPSARSGLKSMVAGELHHGIRRNRKQHRRASLVAAVASVSSAALLSQSRPRTTRRGRVLGAVVLAGLLVTGGLNLSTAARLDTETRTLATLLGQDF
jgi:sphingomyelin phosphodiesterase 2